MAKIDDGTGRGFTTRVDENNRLHVHSVGVTEVVHASEQGLAYNINTGPISVTGNATLLYVKNNEERDLLITPIAIGNNGAATHATLPQITIIRNPSSGDLISDQTAVDMLQNRDFGSSRQLVAEAYKGKTGGTIGGGDNIAILQSSAAGRDFYTIDFAVPEGSSIAVSYTPDISAGTASVYAALVAYLRDPAGQDE
jgi:hypothetical protein